MAAAAAAASHSARRRVLLFDLDGTLYPNNNGYRQHIIGRLFEFMHEHLGVPRSTPAESIWRPLFDKWHQSERGFRAEGYTFDRVHYWRYIRSDPGKFLRTEPELLEFLEALPKHHAKIIFTNAREEQAREALECLGVASHFDAIYGADYLGEVCKPEKEAFEKVLAALPPRAHRGEEQRREVAPPHDDIVFFEDSFKNLVAGKALGMRTVLIQSETVEEEGRSEADFHLVDAVVPRLSLPLVKAAAPFLWDDDKDADGGGEPGGGR